jgi:hypothetical protein
VRAFFRECAGNICAMACEDVKLYVFLPKKQTMLDKDFTKRLMQWLFIISIVWIPVVFLTPIPNLFAGMAAYGIIIGGIMSGLIMHDEYLDKKSKELKNTTGNTEV